MRAQKNKNAQASAALLVYLTLALAAIVLAGWAFEIPALTRGAPNWIAM
jgi:hypothetical protein